MKLWASGITYHDGTVHEFYFITDITHTISINNKSDWWSMNEFLTDVQNVITWKKCDKIIGRDDYPEEDGFELLWEFDVIDNLKNIQNILPELFI